MGGWADAKLGYTPYPYPYPIRFDHCYLPVLRKGSRPLLMVFMMVFFKIPINYMQDNRALTHLFD
ncbi:hypothetical protein SAMN05216315_13819 [Nitrosospira sp. Nsp18]|nr:hypothetical protein SAMN05216315_13819 [Nitrosospira sp. Nsp18]